MSFTTVPDATYSMLLAAARLSLYPVKAFATCEKVISTSNDFGFTLTIITRRDQGDEWQRMNLVIGLIPRNCNDVEQLAAWMDLPKKLRDLGRIPKDADPRVGTIAEDLAPYKVEAPTTPPPSIPPHQARVVDEVADLHAKIGKLARFIDATDHARSTNDRPATMFCDLTTSEQRAMRDQLSSMRVYRAALLERVDLWNLKVTLGA